MSTNTETLKKPKVVSVKLDAVEQDAITKAAKEMGISKSDYLRSIISNAKKSIPLASNTENTVTDGTAEKSGPAAKPENATACTISDESVLLIAEVLSSVFGASTVQPLLVSPDREHLRKLAGKEPEDAITLTVEEESYLQSLNDAIKADSLETLLLEHNSVPIPHNGALQQRMFEQMVAKRNEVVTEKLPSLTKVFQAAITNAFFEDCRTLYNRSLFKATYGIEYNEFKAVFIEA